MRFALLSLALGVGACSGTRIHVDRPPDEVRTPQTATWVAAIKAQGQPGDWLVIRGYKAADDLVVAATNMPLSHAAMLDLERDEVIESVAQGVKVAKLHDFVDHAHRVLLIRPRWSEGDRGKGAIERARGAVGKGYDFSGLVGLSAKDRYYCSELCMFAWAPHQVERDRVPRIIEPGQMYLWGRVLYDSGTRD